MRTYTDKYNTSFDNIDAARRNLDLYGVAVVTGVIPDEECDATAAQFWSELKTMSKDRFDVNDKDTWVNYFETFQPMHGMLLQHHSIGHLQSTWSIRQHPRVAEVFRQLYGLNDAKSLLASFDGVSAHIRHHRRGVKGKPWYHVDQNKPSEKRLYAQGVATLYDVEEGDATLTVYEGSHLHHTEYLSTVPKADWVKVLNLDFYTEKGCKQVYIKCPKGSLLLFDSRTVHSGALPDEATRTHNLDRKRLVFYVCQTPRSGATARDLKAKRTALSKLRVTRHTPYPVKCFAQKPRNYGNPEPDVLPWTTQPNLSELGRALAGFPLN